MGGGLNYIFITFFVGGRWSLIAAFIHVAKMHFVSAHPFFPKQTTLRVRFQSLSHVG